DAGVLRDGGDGTRDPDGVRGALDDARPGNQDESRVAKDDTVSDAHRADGHRVIIRSSVLSPRSSVLCGEPGPRTEDRGLRTESPRNRRDVLAFDGELPAMRGFDEAGEERMRAQRL